MQQPIVTSLALPIFESMQQCAAALLQMLEERGMDRELALELEPLASAVRLNKAVTGIETLPRVIE